MIEREFFDKAAEWVHGRFSPGAGKTQFLDELREAFEALYVAASSAQSTFLIPNLFPGIELDVLYVHDPDGAGAGAGAVTGTPESYRDGLGPDLSAQALNAIGIALAREMEATGNDMFRHRLGAAEVIVSRPGVRALVLQATGTTLLNEQ